MVMVIEEGLQYAVAEIPRGGPRVGLRRRTGTSGVEGDAARDGSEAVGDMFLSVPLHSIKSISLHLFFFSVPSLRVLNVTQQFFPGLCSAQHHLHAFFIPELFPEYQPFPHNVEWILMWDFPFRVYSGHSQRACPQPRWQKLN